MHFRRAHRIPRRQDQGTPCRRVFAREGGSRLLAPRHGRCLLSSRAGSMGSRHSSEAPGRSGRVAAGCFSTLPLSNGRIDLSACRPVTRHTPQRTRPQFAAGLCCGLVRRHDRCLSFPFVLADAGIHHRPAAMAAAGRFSWRSHCGLIGTPDRVMVDAF